MPKKTPTMRDAKAEVSRRDGYVQPNREGKRLIGAYVPDSEIEKFKLILKARGTTTQDYFAQIVTNEIAAASRPDGLKRLVDSQVKRFQATLRPLKR